MAKKTTGAKAPAKTATKKTVKPNAAKANGAKAPGGGKAASSTAKAATMPTRTLRMDLRHQNDNVEITWSVPGRPSKTSVPKEGEPGFFWEGYFVSAGNIDRLSESIRKHLQSLQALDWRVSDTGVDGDAAAFGPILTRLIEDGRDLHAAVLRGIDGEPKSERRSAAFREWFEKNVLSAPPGEWRIEVVHAKYSKLIAPWGLACVPMTMDAVAKLDPNKPEHYANFWGVRFRSAVRGITTDIKETTDERKRVRLACVLELDQNGITHMERRSEREGDTDGMRMHVGWDREGYQALAHRHKLYDLFWYVSLQADAGSFMIGDDQISSADLEINKSQSDADRVVLMMLDGDAVVRGDRGPDWVKKALDIGRSGLIAVEADVRNPQMRLFGWRILRDVLESQEPLLEAMAKARTKWWPLGLLYGIYCSPVHAAVTPPPEETIKQVDRWIDIIRSIQPTQLAEKPS
jgi:hypothetical protein